MKINAKQLEEAGIKITEEVHGAILEAPIKLDTIPAFDRENFTPGNYDVDLERESVYSDGCDILFSLYEDDYIIIESSSLEEIYDYLEERLG